MVDKNDIPSKRRRDNKRRKTKQRKDRGDEPRFVQTKKRTKFNKQQIMRML